MKKADTLTRNLVPGQGCGSDPAAGRGADSNPQKAGRDHIDAINQVFAELELAYHNQFHKAYGQEGALGLAKKYWLEVLQDFPPALLLRAVRQVVRQSEFLPSLAAIVTACEHAYELFGLPGEHAAYIEACCAPEPKARQRWSHPAVFHAGAATGWIELASRAESDIGPVFKYNYRTLCQRVIHGETLEAPIPVALPAETHHPLSPGENRARLQQLRARFKL